MGQKERIKRRGCMDKIAAIKEEKRTLRKKILQCRKEMPIAKREEKSEQIRQKLYQMPVYQKADVLLAYAEYQSEVITTPVIQKALAEGKAVFCPTVQGENMEFYQINSLEELQEGYKGIREPLPKSERKIHLDQMMEKQILMLMPGAVFDTERHRIGYGKGFYDRYLNGILYTADERSGQKLDSGISTVALAFSCQVVEKLPAEEHDVCPDMLLTEKEIYSKP